MFTEPMSNSPTSKPVASLIALAAILVVGWLDFLKGSEVRILALYFLPLLWVGWNLGKSGAVIASIVSTATWLTVLYLSGTRFSSAYMWPANGMTEGSGFLVVSLLVAQLRNSMERERASSRIDPLTGIANRREFMELANLALAVSRRQGTSFALAYIDLNNFKAVNDVFGHDRGDELLCICARLIANSIRASDTVARIGGDEFAVLLRQSDAAHASILTERIRAAIDIDPTFQAVAVSASIGVACGYDAGTDIRSLLHKADANMYRTKQIAKQRVRAARQIA